MKRNKLKIVISCLVLSLLAISSLSALSNSRKNDDKVIEISESKQKLKPGTYFIDINTENDRDQKMSIYRRVHVTYPKTFLNYDLMEGIDAHDIVVLTGTFDKTNKSKIIQQGNARAWSMETGEHIDNINVNVTEPIKYSGTVNGVTYSTDNDTKVNVNVFEQDYIPLSLDELYMNQYSVLRDQIRTLSRIVFWLSVFPIGAFIIVVTIVKLKTKRIEELLLKE